MRRTIQTLIFLFATSTAFAQIYVEQDPFQRWKVVAKKLSFSEITINPADEAEGSLLSHQIAAEQTVVIKAHQPKGFVEVDGKVSFGIGVKVYQNNTQKVILEAKDIYERNVQRVEPELLKSLSLKFTPEEGAQPSDSYLVTVRFFDKQGDGEIVVETSFTVAEKSDLGVAKKVNVSRGGMPSLAIIGQNIDAGSAKILIDDKPVDRLDLKKKAVVTFKADASSFDGKPTNYVSVLDADGNEVFEEAQVFVDAWDGVANILHPTSLPDGPYLISSCLSTSTKKLAFSEWFYLSDAEITPIGREKLALILKEKAWRLMKGKEGREALEVLENADKLLPNNQEIMYAQGFIMNDIGKYESAIEVLTKVVAANPKHYKAWYELGFSHKKTKDFRNAVRCYETCTLLKPNDYFSHYQTGWNFNELKEYDKAIKFLDKAVELNPSVYQQPYFERIHANKQLGNFAMVVQDYEALQELDPNNADFYYQAGYYKIDLQDYEGAVAALTQAIDLDLYSYAPVYERGFANKMLKKYDLAIKDFEKASQLGKGKEPPKTYLHLGDCHMALDKKEEACQYYRKAKELNVNGADEAVKKLCGKN